MAKNNQKGRGWFGDSEGHSKAGRKGGRARARNMREKKKQGGDDKQNLHTSFLDLDNL